MTGAQGPAYWVALAWRLDPLDLIAKQPPDGVYVPLQVLDVCQLHAEHAALTQLPPLGLHAHLLQRAHEDVKVEYRVVDQVEVPHLFQHDGEHGLLAVAQALKLQEALVDTLGLIGLLQALAEAAELPALHRNSQAVLKLERQLATHLDEHAAECRDEEPEVHAEHREADDGVADALGQVRVEGVGLLRGRELDLDDQRAGDRREHRHLDPVQQEVEVVVKGLAACV